MNQVKRSQKEAKELNLIRYWTGEPCEAGHLAERYVSSRHCVVCQKERTAKYQKTQKGKDKSRENHLRKTYGVSLQEVLNAKQCEICFTSLISEGMAGNSVCVDHDHVTGAVRGFLCNNCNRGLGMFMDNKEYLESAITYLNKFADKTIPEEWINERRDD